jgi:hypothetical protein
MRIFILIFLGGDLLSFLAQLTMSIVCLITSITGRRAARFQTALYANRYSSWSLTCLLTWTILGIFSSIMQVILLSESDSEYQAGLGIALAFWFVIFIIGLSLLRTFRMVAIMYAKSFVYAQGNPNDYGQPMPNPQFGMPIYANSGPVNPQNGVYVGQPVYMQPDGQQNNFRPMPPPGNNQYFPPSGNNQYIPAGGASGNNQYVPLGGASGNNQYVPPGGATGNSQYAPPGMLPGNPQNMPPRQGNPQYLPPPQIPPN